MKFLLYAGLSLLLIVYPHGAIFPASTVDYRAKILTQKGHEQLQRGQAQKALDTWSEAYKIYQQSNNSIGIAGSLINQSLALQALGLYPGACQSLIQALKIEGQSWICNIGQQVEYEKQRQQLIDILQKKLLQDKPLQDRPLQDKPLQDKSLQKIQIIALKNLGNVLQSIGKLDVSEIILKQALFIANSTNQADLKNKVLLSLANTEHILYQKALDKYQLTEDPLAKQQSLELTQSKFKDAINYYHQIKAIGNDNNSGVVSLAQLEELELSLEQLIKIDFTNNEGKKTLENQSSIYDLTVNLNKATLKNLPIIKVIQTRAKFANILVQISADKDLIKPFENINLDLNSVALSNALLADKYAYKINNQRMKSFTKGTLGKVYNSLGQTQKSKEYLKKALGLAQSIQAWDIAYRWQHELGRLYKQIGNVESANKFYEAAINNIEEVQSSTLSVNPEFKYRFRDRIEPVYQEYLTAISSNSNPDLNKLIQVKSKLRLAELKNFLQCNRLPLFERLIKKENQEKLINTSPIIYIFKLEEKVEIIIKTTDNNSLVHYTANLKEVSYSVDDFIQILQSPKFITFPEEKFITYSQNLYNLLLLPVEKYLPANGSLIFVLDDYFQGIPFSLLHNGKHYLLENYDTSISLSSRQTQASSAPNLKALVAGISQINPDLSHSIKDKFTPLPEVKTEISNLKQSLKRTVELVNAEFTSKNFQQSMVKRKDFPVVHISTHGKFSSDPEKTFVLAWDKPINVREFEFLLRNRPNLIDLLVLSACQTAKGDKRSTLGIAGVAVMTGARSTLASLWLVEEVSTAQLMGDFYKGLNKGLGKVEALRQAQLTLLKNPEYSHPYYWAPFILVTG